MKRIFIKNLVLSILATSLSTPLSAGTMGPIAPMHNWTGWYIGANAGAMWGPFSAPVWIETLLIGNSVVGPSVQYFNEDLSSFTGGGQIGYNLQTRSNWVFGAEYNFNGARINGIHYVTAAEILPTSRFVVNDTYALTNDWHTSLVARLGYAWNNWLFYGVGGATAANIRFAANFLAAADPSDPTIIYPAASANDNEVMFGGTGGFGISYALSANLNVSVEGRYTSYSGQKFNLGPVAIATLNGINSYYFQPSFAKLDFSTTEALIKINYQFT